MAKSRPLAGFTVAVTRPRGQDGGLVARLRAAGAAVIRAPAVRLRAIQPRRPPKRVDWIVFTSQAAVRLARGVAACGVACVGPATARAARRAGFRPTYVPRRATVQALASGLRRRVRRGEVVLHPCGRERNPVLVRCLNAAGARAIDWILYRSEFTSLPVRRRALRADILTLTSGRIARSVLSIARGKVPAIVCIGPETAREVRRFGIRPAAVARRHDEEGLFEAVIRFAKGIRPARRVGTVRAPAARPPARTAVFCRTYRG